MKRLTLIIALILSLTGAARAQTTQPFSLGINPAGTGPDSHGAWASSINSELPPFDLVTGACAHFHADVIRVWTGDTLDRPLSTATFTQCRRYAAAGIKVILVVNFKFAVPANHIPPPAKFASWSTAFTSPAQTGVWALEVGSEIDWKAANSNYNDTDENYAAAINVLQPLRARGFKIIAGNVLFNNRTEYESLRKLGVLKKVDGFGRHAYESNPDTAVAEYKDMAAYADEVNKDPDTHVEVINTEVSLHVSWDAAAPGKIAKLAAGVSKIPGRFVIFCLQPNGPGGAGPSAICDAKGNHTAFWTSWEAALPPATQPTTAPTFAPPTITVSTAGHRLGVVQAFTDRWQDHVVSTALVAPNGTVLDTLPGPDVAFLPMVGGAYKVIEIIDGQSRTYPVTVGASTRHTVYVNPGSSSSPGDGTVDKPFTGWPTVAPHTEVQIQAGTTVKPLPGHAIDVSAPDLVITSYGSGSCPTILGSGSAVFYCPRDASDLTISGVHINSTVVDSKPTGSFGLLHGTNIAVANVQLGHLTDGISDSGNGITGLLVQHVTEDGPHTDVGRLAMFINSRHVTLLDCTAQGSDKESPLRATGFTGTDGKPAGGITGGLVARCTFSQPSKAYKAAVTIRQGSGLLFDGCTINLGNLSFDSGGASGGSATAISGVVVQNLTVNDAMIEVHQGASDIIYDTVGVTQTTSECFAYQTNAAVSHIEYRNCRGTGPTSLLKFYSAPGDVQVNGCTWTPKSKGLPFAKNSNGPLNIVGANNVTVAK